MSFKHKLAYAVSVVWPAGKFPVAPGTMGSLAALVMLVWLHIISVSWLVVAVIAICSFILAVILVPDAVTYIYTKHGAKKRYDKAKENFDYQEIVIDEFHGMAIAGLPVFLFDSLNYLVALMVAFILFRLFDIFKPWPIRPIDERLLKSKNPIIKAFGVMLDDTIAGVESAIIVTSILSAL